MGPEERDSRAAKGAERVPQNESSVGGDAKSKQKQDTGSALSSFAPVRYWKSLVFILAVGILWFVPNPESLIVKLVERAGLLLILARGLVGYYCDFIDVLEARRR